MVINLEYIGPVDKAHLFLPKFLSEIVEKINDIIPYKKVFVKGDYEGITLEMPEITQDSLSNNSLHDIRDILILSNENETVLGIRNNNINIAKNLEDDLGIRVLDYLDMRRDFHGNLHYYNVDITKVKKMNPQSLLLSDVGVSCNNLFNVSHVAMPPLIGWHKKPFIAYRMQDYGEWTVFHDSRYYNNWNIKALGKIGLYVIDYKYQSKFS